MTLLKFLALAVFVLVAGIGCGSGDSDSRPSDPDPGEGSESGTPSRRSGTIRLEVRAHKELCQPEAQTQLCLQVREPGAAEWENLHLDIRGFNYQWGRRYRVVVREVTDSGNETATPTYELVRIENEFAVAAGSQFQTDLSPRVLRNLGNCRFRLGDVALSTSNEATCTRLSEAIASGRPGRGTFVHGTSTGSPLTLSEFRVQPQPTPTPPPSPGPSWQSVTFIRGPGEPGTPSAPDSAPECRSRFDFRIDASGAYQASGACASNTSGSLAPQDLQKLDRFLSNLSLASLPTRDLECRQESDVSPSSRKTIRVIQSSGIEVSLWQLIPGRGSCFRTRVYQIKDLRAFLNALVDTYPMPATQPPLARDR